MSIEKLCRLEMGEGTGMTGRDKPRHPKSPPVQSREARETHRKGSTAASTGLKGKMHGWQFRRCPKAAPTQCCKCPEQE